MLVGYPIEQAHVDPVVADEVRRRAARRLPTPRLVGFAVVAALTATAGVLAALSLQRFDAPTTPVPPNQAGYLWCCSVRDVSAEWVVPTLRHPAPVGAEAVWVGAQTDDGRFFLQVGTNEFVSPGSTSYQAFWSDGPLHGMPQALGTLAPGDVVRARLVRAGGSWMVTFADRTQGWTHHVRIAYHAGGQGALAEWIEEDPVAVDPVRGSRLFRMAKTQGTTVRDLVVNGAPPSLVETTPETFSDATGTTFAPTVLLHDRFRFRPW